MIVATLLNRHFRQRLSCKNLLADYLKRTVMNDCRLAQDTFLFRQVVSNFDHFFFFFTFVFNLFFILQLFDKVSSTYTYLLADYVAKEAIIIDPVIEQVNRDYSILKRLGLNLLYCGKSFYF